MTRKRHGLRPDWCTLHELRTHHLLSAPGVPAEHVLTCMARCGHSSALHQKPLSKVHQKSFFYSSTVLFTRRHTCASVQNWVCYGGMLVSTIDRGQYDWWMQQDEAGGRYLGGLRAGPSCQMGCGTTCCCGCRLCCPSHCLLPPSWPLICTKDTARGTVT